MFWQVLQFFQSFFWNDYHDISTVYYILISIDIREFPGFIVSYPPLWSLQNQKIWRNRTEGGKLKACRHAVGSSAVGWPWCFLHLTSIRTSNRGHLFGPTVQRIRCWIQWSRVWHASTIATFGMFRGTRFVQLQQAPVIRWDGLRLRKVFCRSCEAWRPQLWTRDGMRWWMRVTWTSPWSISDESETFWMKGSKWNAVIQMCVSKWKTHTTVQHCSIVTWSEVAKDNYGLKWLELFCIPQFAQAKLHSIPTVPWLTKPWWRSQLT